MRKANRISEVKLIPGKKRIFILILFLISCSGSVKVLDSFEEFVLNTESEYKNFDENDWAEADTTFSDFKEYFSKERLESLSEESVSRYNFLAGKYQGLSLVHQTKNAIDKGRQKIDFAESRAKGFIEGLKTTLDSISK